MSLYIGGLIAYLCGMGLFLTMGGGFSMIFALCLLIVTLIGVAIGRCRPLRIFYAVLFLVGVALLSAKAEPSPTVFDNYIDRYVEVEGVICEVPDEYDEYDSYIVALDRLSYLGEDKKIDEKIRITCEERLDAGNRVAFRGFIDEISLPDNSTEFNYRTYYKSKGITHKMHAEEAELIKARAFIPSLLYAAEYVKSRIELSIDRFYSNDDAAMLKAVLLGIRSNFSPKFTNTLKRTSALRFLYPSYLHIFLLLSVCQVLFTVVRPRYREIAKVLAILVFVLLNAGAITFVRAGVLLAVDVFFRRVRGFSHFPDTISAVILASLIAEPLLIYSSGFVMSITMGILLNFFRYPLALSFEFIKKPIIRTMLSMWIIGTVGLIPLSAYYFNGLPLYSIIFTAVYTPLTIILLITAPPVLLLKEFFSTASVLGVLVDGTIDIMKKLPEIVGMLPGNHITLPKTTILVFAVWIAVCYGIKLVLDGRRKEPIFKLCTAAVIIFIAVGAVSAVSDFGKLFVTFPNVGQGDAAIVEVKGKSRVLIDGGGGTGDEKYNIGEEVYLPYLTAKGYNKIDLAIVSHSHRDHAEGIIAALEMLDIHSLMLSDTMEDNSYRDKLVETAEAKGTEIIYVSAGDRIEFNSGLTIDVIYPDRGASVYDENNYSLCLKMTYDGTTLFFGGDITKSAEEDILGKVGETHIVKVSHHGSVGSSSKEFIGETSPKYAVVQSGKNNMYGHPTDRVVRDYVASGAKILRTDYMNDIMLKSNGGGRVAAGWFGGE